MSQLQSSHGIITFDPLTGIVIDDECDTSGWPRKYHPAIVNTVELRNTYGEVPSHLDILDTGYIMQNGDYEGPCEDWRRDCKQRLGL